jgi:predicted metalloprotease
VGSRRFRAAALIPVLLALSGCGPTATIDGRGDALDANDADEPAELDLDDVLADVEQFWTDEYPTTYGAAYEPLEGGFHPFSSIDDPPDCGEPLTYRDVAGNAYYCPVGDLIAWDEQGLLPKLEEQFGPLSIALVMAHEWGHAIQARANVSGATILLEQQADCFAGAWTARLAAGESESVSLGSESLDAALAGMLFFSDQPGTPASDPSAHGLGFDRVSAFQDGFEEGAPRCAEYPDEPPVVLAALFEEQGQFVPNNLPYVEAIPLIVTDLDEFWTNELPDDFRAIDEVLPYDVNGSLDDLPRCGSDAPDPELLDNAVLYCAATNTVAFDDEFLRRVHQRIGDFGSAILIANRWSQAVQQQTDAASEVDDPQLHADCLSGAWVANILVGNSENITLTPDDLDEVVRAFLAVNVGVSEGAESGELLAFDRVQALRIGMLNGLPACAQF